MAIAATIVFEVQPGISGASDDNGGGFKPGASGSDFSQQAAPQYALTGLVTAGAGAVVLSAAAAADMVGNLLRVVSGTNFTVGTYEILSVSVGVSITVDRNLCTGVGASGVINIGGALNSLITAAARAVTENTIYVKGTNAETTAVGLTLDAGIVHLKFIGYTSTRGDNGRATLTTSTNSTNLVTYPTSTNGLYTWQNFVFSNTASTRAFGHTAGTGGSCYFNLLVNCIFDGFSIGVNGRFSTQHTLPHLCMIACEVKNSTTQGLDLSGPATLFLCYVHDNTGNGLLCGEGNGPEVGAITIINCCFAANSVRGVDDPTHGARRFVLCFNSVFYENGSDGFRENNGSITLPVICVNCIFWSNGAYGVDAVLTTGQFFARNNSYGDNATAARLNFPAGTGDVAITSDPFTDGANDDFSLNATAGGGADLKNQGFNTLPVG